MILAVVLVVGAAFAVVLGLTGGPPGNALAGIRVLARGHGSPIGVGRALLRQPSWGRDAADLGPRRGRPGLDGGDGPRRTAARMARPPRSGPWSSTSAGCPTEEPEQDSRPRHIVNLTALALAPTPEPPPVPRVPRPSTPPPAQPPVQAPTQTPTPAPQPAPAASAPRHAAVPAGAGASSPRQQLVATRCSPSRAPDDGGAHAARLVETPAETPAPTPAPAAPAATRWRVGFDTGESFVVDGPGADRRRREARDGEQVRHLVPLPSDDMSLSKTHAQVLVSGEGTLVVTDRGSTNGSILIRQGVPRGLASGKAAHPGGRRPGPGR